MKLTLKIEDGQPVIFWTDDPAASPGRVTCYTFKDEHGEATRAYMRGLQTPHTIADLLACFDLLERWSKHCAYTLKF